MPRSTRQFSVTNDAATVRVALVQQPLGPRRSDRSAASGDEGGSSRRTAATVQHERVVGELRNAGITVLQFESVLAHAVGCADGRDWILERRLELNEPASGGESGLMSWLQDMPPRELARVLVEGVDPEDVPEPIRRQMAGTKADADSRLPALPSLSYPRDSIRWVADGVVIGQSEEKTHRAVAVNVATALHFAPVFDEAHFEFWLSSDGAEAGWPPIDGRDIAMLGLSIVVCAITRTTSAAALKLLAAGLFRRRAARNMLWLDLTGSGVGHLDECLIALDEDCILADRSRLERAPVSIVRRGEKDETVSVVAGKTSALTLLAGIMAPASLRVIDMSRLAADGVAASLASIAPLVVMPGKVIAYEEHGAAFPILNDYGIEVLAAVPGSALMRSGRGPRNLAAIISADGPGGSASRFHRQQRARG